MKRIAILTSGGDSQAMNNTIVTITNLAISQGWEVFYIMDGYKGLYENKILPSSEFNYLFYANLGGSFIGSARFPLFKKQEYRSQAIKNLKSQNINKLVVIGGNGSYLAASNLSKDGIICAALPGTIDNDVFSSDFSIGFDTALNVVVDAIRKVKDTMSSHNMCVIVEIMGRNCSDLAIFAGIATNANAVVCHEMNYTEEDVINIVKKAKKTKEKGIIIAISEHIFDVHHLAKRIEKEANIGTRACVLGHIQRGGRPTAMDSYRSSLMAWKVFNEFKKTRQGFCVGWKEDEPKVYSFKEALKMQNNNRLETAMFFNKYRNLL